MPAEILQYLGVERNQNKQYPRTTEEIITPDEKNITQNNNEEECRKQEIEMEISHSTITPKGKGHRHRELAKKGK
ncbi:hypothetical protein CHS0354_020619 [Potamilus streckersoni]|uniref:Uncharacterized protein n=1 Tax=Potamilus streckersoni TaxID=2493646 RepID=A0AAE0SQI6_9BIVA|nr:hypothetical protein CHS0354_020619 [Potamilus streckersoni]